MMSNPAVHSVTAAVSQRILGSSEPRMAIQAAAGAIPRENPSTRCASDGEALGEGVEHHDRQRQGRQFQAQRVQAARGQEEHGGPEHDESPGEPAREEPGGKMPRPGAGIAGVDIGVQDAVKRHGDRPRRDHRQDDPGQLDPQQFARESGVAPGQQRSGEREGEGEHGVLELDHFERQANSLKKLPQSATILVW